MSESMATAATGRRILVACVGNIFLGDDGFGVAVAERLRGRRFPEGVQVVDFGIRGVELAYTMLDGYDTLVLVDAVPRGGPPGTLYLIEATPPDPVEQGPTPGRAALDGHSMDPVKVLAFARAMGAPPVRTLIVGCEPSSLADDDAGVETPVGLSEPVHAAVEGAVTMVDALLRDLCPAGA